MRSQLRDHADICGTLVMAPPVEKILRSKEETNPDKLFNNPITKIHVGLHVSFVDRPSDFLQKITSNFGKRPRLVTIFFCSKD